MESYVYFLTDDHGHIKIGKADDVGSRMKELQTGNPFKLRLLLSVKMKNSNEAYGLEQALHMKFVRQRLEGEWYREEAVLDMLAEDVISVGNYEFHGRGVRLPNSI